LEARAKGSERIDVINPPTDPYKYFPSDPEAEQWKKVWNSILDINRLARDKDVHVVLILFPLEFQVLDENYSTLPQEIFMAKAAEAGIPALDLLPTFRQACREKPGGTCQLEDRYLFADVWMHPSSVGNKLTADELEALLSRMFEQ
jgi:hypothetical protein